MTPKDIPLPEPTALEALEAFEAWAKNPEPLFVEEQMHAFAEQYATAKCAELEGALVACVTAMVLQELRRRKELHHSAGVFTPTWDAALAKADAVMPRTEVKP